MPNSFFRKVPFVRPWPQVEPSVDEALLAAARPLGWTQSLPFSRSKRDNLPSVLQCPHLLSSCCDNLVN